MVHDLLARRLAIDLSTLMHVLEQFRSCGLGDAVLEVGADVCSAVWAVLLAQVIENERRRLVWRELHLLLVFLGGRHLNSW